MRIIHLDEREAQARLEASVSGLAERAPQLSARNLLTRRQRNLFLTFTILFAVGLLLSPVSTLIGLIGIATFFYMAVVLNRVLIFWRSMGDNSVEFVSDEEARGALSETLPVYTILVPCYREPEVIRLLMSHLANIDYPVDRLDVKVLLEADDRETMNAIRDIDLGGHVEIVPVPPGEPRTKPKALNYGLSLARGDLVTVYDAEDQPEPLQLRRAAIALGRLDAGVACLQAKLSYSNTRQNLITKWFTIEYAMWFSLFLPGLVSLGAPLPLGGTSNHFRRDVLEAMGAWDPHNVTEDADLGVRFSRHGYKVKILDSVTLEEANSDFVNWVKQRSRWYKGYLQTCLIHLRHPVHLAQELGPMGFAQFVLFVGGTPLLAVLNPIFWILTALWFGGHPAVVKTLFPAPIFYAGLFCWSFGNFAIAYLTIISCQMVKRVELLWAAFLVPIYWVMMAVAGIKATIQLISAPTYWEKTVHGLSHEATLSPRPSDTLTSLE